MGRLGLISLYILCVGCILSCSKQTDVPNLVTEMCDVSINSSGIATKAVLDNGVVLDIASQGLTSNVSDTTVRSVLTYAWVDGVPCVYDNIPAICMRPASAESFETCPHDPVKLVSVWQMGRYINLVIGEMTTGNGTHEYAFCMDSLKDGVLYTSFLHRQPATDAGSFTQKRYASMPVCGNGVEAYDSVCLSICTYDGVRKFVCASAAF